MFQLESTVLIYLINISIFNPEFILCEGYWFSTEKDWLIYVSHENTITIGGEWLINEIKACG
ncbi:hypothetical protein SH2C18_45490 [Clostridium sediminicola]|uniref:hypothetical protein n=1 Tax=Clostridium sediminicola TaxID=3114879 RepID=UPI0031F20B63